MLAEKKQTMRLEKKILLVVGLISGVMLVEAQNVKYAEPVKLPLEVNSDDGDEVMPIFHNGRLFYSRLKLNGKSLNIWMSENKSGHWTPGISSFSVNNEDHNAIVGMAADRSRAYLLNHYGKETNTLGLSVSKISGDNWSDPVAVEIEGLEFKEGETYGFFVKPSEDVILISMTGPDTKGGEDLYVSLKKEGKWQKPINLGGTINSSGFEISPFMADDGVTLYFSTNGRGGEGDADIFRTKRLDDSWTRWTIPENLGKPVNSDAFDAYFTLDSKGVGYFSSTRGAECSDIFRVEEAKQQEAKGTKVDSSIVVSGNVFSEKMKDPIDVEIDVTDNDNGFFHKRVRTSADGSYSLNLMKGKNYVFNVLVPKYHEYHEAFSVKVENAETNFKNDILMQELKVGTKLKMDRLFFVISTDTLLESSLPVVDKLGEILLKNPGIKIRIEGHTDNSGTSISNNKLSLDRATRIRTILIEKGIKKKRMKVEGFGARKPLVKNLTPEDKQKNRRVEFVIID